jgi:hypothetical protein
MRIHFMVTINKFRSDSLNDVEKNITIIFTLKSDDAIHHFCQILDLLAHSIKASPERADPAMLSLQ